MTSRQKRNLTLAKQRRIEKVVTKAMARAAEIRRPGASLPAGVAPSLRASASRMVRQASPRRDGAVSMDAGLDLLLIGGLIKLFGGLIGIGITIWMIRWIVRQ